MENSISEKDFIIAYNKAYQICLLRDIEQDKTYINCVGEIKKGDEIKLYSDLDWKEIVIANEPNLIVEE